MSKIGIKVKQSLLTKFTKVFGINRHLSLTKEFSLVLPPGHRLPEYMQVHSGYDRFLNKLSCYLPQNSIVIDVGANVGDTMATLLTANSSLKVICFEPDPGFFSYLAKNAKSIQELFPTVSVENHMKFVGSPRHGKLVGNSTTLSVEEDFESGKLDYITLEEVATKAVGASNSSVSLIKSDVDGFDWDVLQSGLSFIAKSKPLLFFECLIDTPKQLENYASTVSKLEKIGYKFFVFDNLGNLMLGPQEGDAVKQVLNYVDTKLGVSLEPIHYIDVLAFFPGQDPNIAKFVLNAFGVQDL